MSGECDQCGEHTLECRCKEKHMNIIPNQLRQLIAWARRYCDYRMTFAPHIFNELYDNLVQLNPILKEIDVYDEILFDHGKFWPYAQDGNYNEVTGHFDARPNMKSYKNNKERA